MIIINLKIFFEEYKKNDLVDKELEFKINVTDIVYKINYNNKFI